MDKLGVLEARPTDIQIHLISNWTLLFVSIKKIKHVNVWKIKTEA